MVEEVCRMAERVKKKEQQSIPEILNEIAAEICDKICRFPLEVKDEDDLYDKYCVNCPMLRLL